MVHNNKETKSQLVASETQLDTYSVTVYILVNLYSGITDNSPWIMY